MSQPSLFGEPSEATDRLLFALYPDPENALCISEQRRVLMQDNRLAGPTVGSDRLHVTLIHIGDFIGLPQGIVAPAAGAAAKVSSPAFDVALGRAMSFSGQPGNLPLVLRAETTEALMAFQRALRTELARAGVRHKSGTQFTPHVTLLRDRRSVPDQPIDPIRWTAREFVLVHSLLGKAQHIALGRWSLGRT